MERRSERAASGTGASLRRRTMSFVLLAVHLVVFVLGASVGHAGQTPGHATRHALVRASSAAGDGAVVVSAGAARLDPGTRPRGDGSDRGAGTPPLDAVLPLGLPPIPPAGLAGTLEGGAASCEKRPPVSLVHGARGPPTAR